MDVMNGVFTVGVLHSAWFIKKLSNNKIIDINCLWVIKPIAAQMQLDQKWKHEKKFIVRILYIQVATVWFATQIVWFMLVTAVS
jgi:hypothetical protein